MNEQITNHTAPLIKKAQDFTQLIQGMTTAQNPTSHRRASTSASFSAATYQRDMLTGVSQTGYNRLSETMASTMKRSTTNTTEDRARHQYEK